MTLPSEPLAAARQFLSRLPMGATVLVAVSGGSDSTGLLVALRQANLMQQGRNIRLVAATIDHRLRPEGAEEAREVGALCARLGIPHLVRAWETEKPTSALSEAAREARYDLLTDMAAEFEADLMVTAHTADDQAETVAMRSARNPGSSNAGLAGIAEAMLFDRRLWVMRPFLSCRRGDIRALLEKQSIGWIDDPSNDDEKYERVRVRKGLAGQMQDADASAAERRRSVSLEAAAIADRHLQVFANTVAFLPSAAVPEDPSALRYLVGFLAAILGGRPFAPPSENVATVVATFRNGGGGRWNAGRVLFDLRRDGLYMLRERRNLPAISVPAGSAGTWDGRFLIENRGGSAIDVRSADATAEVPAPLAALPKGIARGAVRVLPAIAGGQEATVAIESILSPFDRFLPGFDCSLANALASHFGRQPYPGPPVTGGVPENA